MTRHYFITASGTGVGKTLVTTTLNYQLGKAGIKTTALKPIISGFDEFDVNNDSAQILASSFLPHDKEHLEMISPWRFSAPLSPNMAADLEGKKITLNEVVDFCKQPREVEITLVEGAGGVMVPLNDTHTMLDVMEVLNWPIILVVGSYLGAISHALTSLAALQQQGLKLQAVVVSESENSTVDFEKTVFTLRQFIDKSILVVPLPRLQAGYAQWLQCADLSWVVK